MLEILGKSIDAGLRLIRYRFRLIVLIYTFNLVLALLVVAPLYSLFVETVGGTGFGVDLGQDFDFVLWSEIFRSNMEGLEFVFERVIWALPIYWVWKTAIQVGLIYALHHGAIWPFWSGVFLHTGRGMALGLFFLILKSIWILTIYLIISLIQPNFSGEVETFWLVSVVAPAVLLSGLAIIELYQRYGRLALVVQNKKVWASIKAGLYWPGRTSVVSLVFLCWYAVAFLSFFASMALNASLNLAFHFIVLAFLAQQALLLLRSAITVGWVGSEVFLFERVLLKK